MLKLIVAALALTILPNAAHADAEEQSLKGIEAIAAIGVARHVCSLPIPMTAYLEPIAIARMSFTEKEIEELTGSYLDHMRDTFAADPRTAAKFCKFMTTLIDWPMD